MNLIFPCVFGYFSLGHSSTVFYPPKGVESLYTEHKDVGIYKIGKSNEIHFYKDKNQMILIFGRVYSPIQINPHVEDDKENLIYFAEADFNKIQGSFVCITRFFNEEKSKSKLITDKFGFRRILYYQDKNILYFSTHLLGLRILLNKNLLGISREALLHYYNFGFTPNNQTLIRDIQKVPPGSALTVKDGSFYIKPYFHIERLYHPEKYARWPERKICKAIDDMMLRAVRIRIPQNDSVGVSLSGGVDSGYIATKLVKCGVHPVGYNLAYAKYYDEFDRIDYLSKVVGIKVRKISVSASQIIENYEYCNSISSEPMGFNNATMRFPALEAQKDGIFVLFDGDGADRIFLGMTRYLQFQKVLQIYNYLKKTGFLSLTKRVLKLTPGNEFKKLYIHFQNWSRGICPYPERDMGGLTKYNAEYEQKVYDLAISHFRKSFERKFHTDDFALYFTYQAIQMCPEMFFYDPSEIQTVLRIFPVPAYWDDDLVSLAISLPTKWKLRRSKSKYILRKAAARDLNKKYWMKPKIGLQDSFNYILKSEIGRRWQSIQHKKIMDSSEYETLQKIVPGGNVNLNKLISVIVWKEQNFLE